MGMKFRVDRQAASVSLRFAVIISAENRKHPSLSVRKELFYASDRPQITFTALAEQLRLK